jgi:hypothetical protein
MKKKLLLWIAKLLSPKTTDTIADDLKFTKIAHIIGESDYGTVDCVMQTIPYTTWFMKTPTKHLFCADNHIVAMSDGSFKMVKDITIGEMVSTDTGEEAVIQLSNTGIAQHMYSVGVYSSDIETNNLYITNGIVSKNTATSAAYLLWKAMYFPNITILICANVASAAIEVLTRAKWAYENCPDFLKPGVLKYNDKQVAFDNGSRIICQATTANSGRGLSIGLLYCTSGDTTVTVYDTVTGMEKLITMEQLHKEVGDYADNLVGE